MQDVVFRDRAVYLPDADALVLADLHIGRAEASDIDFPLGERAALRERVTALLARFEPAEVVFAGDVLHDFSQASVAAERSVRALIDCCTDAGSDAVLVEGNHDPMLSDVWEGPLHGEYLLADDTVICHGHEEPETRGTRYVLGHDHPTIDIEGKRHPCYLLGAAAYRGRDLLMLPAFTRLAAGVEVNDMTAANFHSPLISDADGLRPVVHDTDSDEVLRFPPLGRFRSML